MDGEDVAVRAVAGGRTGAAVVVVAVVIADVARASRQAGGGIFREAACFGGQVDDIPVPETGTSRRIRVVAGKGKALCAGRRVRPVQFGRVVLTAGVGVDVC